MSDPKLEEVFKVAGVPTYTFVEPKEYNALLVSLRTAGRPVVVEGPSGIGKTSAVETALEKLEMQRAVTKLSARKPKDVEYISELPNLGDVGVVIVDDFHRLPDTTKAALADYLKTLADEERKGTKVIIIGINRAGERLVHFASDLGNRLEVIPFETNPENKVRELVTKGEAALNVKINVIDEIVASAQGSFYVAQMLCHAVCLKSEITERSAELSTTEISFEAIRTAVWERLKPRFMEHCKTFCRGTKMKPEGRAPYLHLLHLLAEGTEWSLSMRDAIRRQGNLRGSISQVVEKQFIDRVFADHKELADVLHYDSGSKLMTVEDPQFVFFLKQIPWARFARELGFLSVDFANRYDFALSFAGSDRSVAEAIFDGLQEREVEVFYDRNEQHRILAEDVEEYLGPIYQSEARFVVALLGPDYPKRIWTKFESDQFKERFKEASVIPIWFANAAPGLLDVTRKVGGLDFDPAKDLTRQAEGICEFLVRKLADVRGEGSERPSAVQLPLPTKPQQ